jgi:hypothetical protein
MYICTYLPGWPSVSGQVSLLSGQHRVINIHPFVMPSQQRLIIHLRAQRLFMSYHCSFHSSCNRYTGSLEGLTMPGRLARVRGRQPVTACKPTNRVACRRRVRLLVRDIVTHGAEVLDCAVVKTCERDGPPRLVVVKVGFARELVMPAGTWKSARGHRSLASTLLTGGCTVSR